MTGLTKRQSRPAPPPDDRPQALARAFAPPARRAALDAIFALDDRLAAIVRTTREPFLGQMRLTWWRDALGVLGDRPAPDEPLLAALAAAAVPGAPLARMADGWEALLAPDPLSDAAILAFADGRGGGLFASAAAMLGAEPRDPIAAAGAAWALLDLGAHARDGGLAARARALAVLPDARWSRRGRPLGALALLARIALEDRPVAGALRLARFRLTGR